MDSETIYRNALALEEEGKHNDAVILYKELTASSTDPRFHIAFGVCLQRLGHWEESIKHLAHGIELKPHYCEGDARLFLAESLLKSGHKKQAIAQWTIVAAMEPEYPSYQWVPDEAKRGCSQSTMPNKSIKPTWLRHAAYFWR
jgi:tetratricopeptide (TPR) repeat protein